MPYRIRLLGSVADRMNHAFVSDSAVCNSQPLAKRSPRPLLTLDPDGLLRGSNYRHDAIVNCPAETCRSRSPLVK